MPATLRVTTDIAAGASQHPAHLRGLADDDVRYLAHHYTRYLSPEQVVALIDEVRTSFRMNGAIFDELAA